VGGLHCELARCAACPEDQHCLAGPEVAAVVERHPVGHPDHLESGGEAGPRPGWTGKAAASETGRRSASVPHGEGGPAR
jgi:hypothetical protein